MGKGAKFPTRRNLRDTIEVLFKVVTDGSGVTSSITNDKYDAVVSMTKTATGLYTILLRDGFVALHDFRGVVENTRDTMVFLGAVSSSGKTVKIIVTDTSNTAKNLVSKTTYFKLTLTDATQ